MELQDSDTQGAHTLDLCYRILGFLETEPLLVENVSWLEEKEAFFPLMQHEQAYEPKSSSKRMGKTPNSYLARGTPCLKQAFLKVRVRHWLKLESHCLV